MHNMPIDLTKEAPVLNHNIELVFFDIDGTLLAENGHYSSGLRQQINRLHHQGIKTAIASGRPSYAAQFLFDELAISDLGVFCTGAEIYHPKTDEHIQCHALPLGYVHTLYERVKSLGLYCEFYTPKYHTTDIECDISRIHAQHLRAEPVVMNGDTLLGQDVSVIKLLLGRKKHDAGPSLLDLSREFSEVEFAFAHFLARPEWEFASVISRSANKNVAFDAVLNHYGLGAQQVMSIGDSHSDKMFIQRAGVGVAMGNASEDVKNVADYITHKADDDGVAYALEKLVYR